MESTLTGQLKQSSNAALEEAYTAYHARIYSFIYHKTQSSFIAEEVVQLTFIRLWKQRASLKESIDLQVQLFGMARQEMINEIRKEATRFKYNDQFSENPYTDSLMKIIESRDILKHLESELERQPPIRKMIFNLSRKQGMSHKEIADMLSISTKTVENHIGKVLMTLKQYMYTIF